MSGKITSLLQYLTNRRTHHHDHHPYDRTEWQREHFGQYCGHGFSHPHDNVHLKSLFGGMLLRAVERLMRRKRLVLLIVVGFLIAGTLFLVCGAWLVVKLVGIISPHLADLEKSGLKGLVDLISKIISQIWNGTGK